MAQSKLREIHGVALPNGSTKVLISECDGRIELSCKIGCYLSPEEARYVADKLLRLAGRVNWVENDTLGGDDVEGD